MNPDLVQVIITCNKFGITRADRLEWASVVLDCNVESFRQLGPVQAARLVDAANGAAYMALIRMERHRGVRI